MDRVLCIVSNLNQGGAETFLMKILRNIDREKYCLDFCLMSDINGKYEEEAKSLGSMLYRVVPKSKNPVKCFLGIRKIVKENKYKSVMRVSEHSLAVLELIAAKCGGAKKLIMRSSNAKSGSLKSTLLHKLFNFLPRLVPNVKIAPSTEAALYTFGKKNVEKGKINFLQNGLLVKDFIYDGNVREGLRKQLGLENSFIVGHVGRFQAQKNHKFLIEIFNQISARKENAKLVLVGGNGELLEQTRNQVKSMGMEEKVLFLGNRNDVPELLSMFDVLVFPSFFEGMPNVVIEAQAAGLPCLISDTITKEADITGLVKYFSLGKSAEEWAEEAISHSLKFERRSYEEEISSAGYTIEEVAKKFTKLVF